MKKYAPFLLLLLLATQAQAQPSQSRLVDPINPPEGGSAVVGDHVGPILADNAGTTPVRIQNVTGDNEIGLQIWGVWDGASVTGEMRLCSQQAQGNQTPVCEYVPIPGWVWPITETSVVGPINVYYDTQIRLVVTGAGASTSLLFIVAN